ncbi:hypothetical protein BH10BAC3_BH10BAC3_20520 [soil metagenome]
MKKFRIVTDSFLGYEVQVKYALFPFKWFQLNDYYGVNSSNTWEEAVELINQSKSVSHKAYNTQKDPLSVDYQLALKFFLKTGICNKDNIVWQERFIGHLMASKKTSYDQYGSDIKSLFKFGDSKIEIWAL